jgi:hypothetical protein
MKRLTSAGLAVFSSLCWGSAMADNNDSAKWTNVGPWQVLVDKTMNNGCFMMGGYPGIGVMLRVGINNLNNTAYFIIGNRVWQSLEAGKRYQLGGQFDGGSIEYWTATAIKMGNRTFLMVPINSPSPDEVVQKFGQRLNFRLYYSGNLLASMNLKAAAAAAETINCNHQLAATRIDPFQSGAPTPHPAVSRDPFAETF